MYRSISAFSPVVNPVAVLWGQAALAGYLGDDRDAWRAYDACELLKNYTGPKLPVLVDQVRRLEPTRRRTEMLASAAGA